MNTALKRPAGMSEAGPEPIRNELRRRLLSLNFHAFAWCLCLLLERLGYEQVRVADRTDWKGRNSSGGYDVEAYLTSGIARRKVIVQIKQYDTLPVYQRSVDELRGTCLRAGAVEALLITTSTFSPVIQKPVFSPVAPVRLLGGDELLDLLLLHRIGVWEEISHEEAGNGVDTPRRIGLDTAYFEDLAQTYAGNSRHSVPKFSKREKATSANAPFRFLTIQVNLPAAGGKGQCTGRRDR